MSAARSRRSRVRGRARWRGPARLALIRVMASAVVRWEALRVAALGGALLLAGAVVGQETQAPPQPTDLQWIDRDDLLRHAGELAGERFGGRLVGSPGEAAAADYVAEHLARLGLLPFGDETDSGRGFQQYYPVQRTSCAATTELQLGEDVWREGFSILSAAPMAVAATGSLRFAGVGATRGRECSGRRMPGGEGARHSRVASRSTMAFMNFARDPPAASSA